MRNPIRLKNLRLRFLPLYLLGGAILVWLPPSPGTGLVAAVPIALGLALRSWGAGHLVKTDALTVTGPYAYLRHPLYLGTLSIATGFAIAVGSWVGVGLLALLWPWFGLVYFPRKDRSEGERLAARHGEAYEAYRKAVPALWPRASAWRPALSAGAADASARWRLARYSDNNELGTLLAVLGGLLVLWLRARGSAA